MASQQQPPSTTQPRGLDFSDSLAQKQQDSSDSEEVLINVLTSKLHQVRNLNLYFLCMYLHHLRKRFWLDNMLILLIYWKPVPDDNKAYVFSCSNNNTNKLSLTTAKPKAKVDSYTSWNKAFRVLIEIVALQWPDQYLPMFQYAAELLYNYHVKFQLKKQSHHHLPWNEIDNRLWTKCLQESKKATSPVLFNQIR